MQVLGRGVTSLVPRPHTLFIACIATFFILLYKKHPCVVVVLVGVCGDSPLEIFACFEILDHLKLPFQVKFSS